MSFTGYAIFNNMLTDITTIPSKEQRQQIYEQSNKAREQSLAYSGPEDPKDLLSKIDCKNPRFTDTIFATRLDLAVFKDDKYAVFITRDPIFIGGSMGVNCVPVKPVSINLFDTDEETTNARLSDFIKWRNANELNILRAFLYSLKQFINVSEKKIVLENALLSHRPEFLNIEMIDYINTVSMFQSILEKAEKKGDLSDVDIQLGSVCQTWFKKGIVGKPSFSVPSPHIQTFFYKKKPSIYSKETDDDVSEEDESYYRVLKILSHDMTTKIVDGKLEYEQSFIDLDGMWKKMNQKNMFFLNSSPNFDTLPLIKDAYESIQDGKFYVVFSSNLSEYMEALSVIESNADEDHVHLLPSNFRAPINIRTKINGLRCNFENKSQIQENISFALSTILSWCKRENIDVFFASAPRDSRPLFIKSPESLVKKSNSKYFDKELTIKVLEELVAPSLSVRMKMQPSPELIVEALDEYTEKKASFLADIGTVAVACELIDEPNCWSTYNLIDEPVVKYVDVNSNKLPKSSYVSANFVSGVGKFRDINDEGKRKVGEAIRKVLERKESVFDLCYVMHDEFLNDIDDPAANDLCRQLTKKNAFYLFRNHIR
jgi:hypothetical protein